MAVSTVTANIAHFTGEDKTIDVVVYASDLMTPRDISGWCMDFVVHAYGDPSTIFFTKSTTAGTIILNNPTTGQLEILVFAADTTNMRATQEYEFYLERCDPGEVCVVTHGLYTVLRL
jgi:hypothetical protein